MQRSTQLSLIAFLVTLAALPVSDGLAATSHPTDTTEGTQTVDDRLFKLAVAIEQQARGAENLANLPSEFSSLLAGFVNAGGFRNGGGGGGFINGGGFRNGGGGGGFANFRNY